MRGRDHSPLIIREEPSGILATRVAEVVRRHEGKSVSPNIRYFVAISGFVAIYSFFGRLWAKKDFFLSKYSVHWARSAWYLLNIILN